MNSSYLKEMWRGWGGGSSEEKKMSAFNLKPTDGRFKVGKVGSRLLKQAAEVIVTNTSSDIFTHILTRCPSEVFRGEDVTGEYQANTEKRS